MMASMASMATKVPMAARGPKPTPTLTPELADG